MGFTNTNTENFEVYLTPFAREKLYTGKGGKIDIKYFSLHDGDINYTKSAKTQSFSTTPAGKYTQVPNLRGEPSTIGINGCQIYQLGDFVVRTNKEKDEKCPDGYYKNDLGVCVEKIFNTKITKERKVKRVDNTTMMGRMNSGKTTTNRMGVNTRIRGNNTSGVVPGGSSY
tara:strand:- start:1991 stop:2503 length:513 start_codon:yes stop_codon:yes gene_type:complete